MDRLVVFDIDGTLTDTNGVDDECYCNAVAAALGVSPSDIDWSRAEIIQVAIARAERAYDSRFERIVAVGDGPWDVNAAVLLGLPFIGIGSGERAELLRSAGASVVLAYYDDLDEFHRALANARVPGTDHAPSRSAFSGARHD